MKAGTTAVTLSIAASDSGGGAGIQADLNTFAALGVFGTCAITCVTAQDPSAVRDVHPLPPGFVAEQIDTVLDAFPVAAVKTGMLYSAGIVRSVAKSLARRPVQWLVIDPVMVASSGARLLSDEALRALRNNLLPLASLVTPNIPEAEVLSGMRIRSLDDMKRAAEAIASAGPACCIKGGHLRGGATVADVLSAHRHVVVFAAPRAPAGPVHGTGCTFSAAVAAMLARGTALEDAVRTAGQFVRAAMASRLRVGRHAALNWSHAPRRVRR